MVTQALLDYVQAELARGIGKDAIIHVLTVGGWTPQDANDALTALMQLPVPQPEPPVSFAAPTITVAVPTAVSVMTPPSIVTVPKIAESASPQAASTLEEKAAKIEMTYDTAVEKVNELGGAQRQIVTDSVKKLEERKIDEIKKRLLPS